MYYAYEEFKSPFGGITKKIGIKKEVDKTTKAVVSNPIYNSGMAVIDPIGLTTGKSILESPIVTNFTKSVKGGVGKVFDIFGLSGFNSKSLLSICSFILMLILLFFIIKETAVKKLSS